MIMHLKFSRKDPTPFGAKSHRARPHLGSNPTSGVSQMAATHQSRPVDMSSLCGRVQTCRTGSRERPCLLRLFHSQRREEPERPSEARRMLA